MTERGVIAQHLQATELDYAVVTSYRDTLGVTRLPEHMHQSRASKQCGMTLSAKSSR